MKIIEEYIENININDKLAIALGNFDGIHLGHRKLIEQAITLSKLMDIKSAVFTFDSHPLKLLKPGANIKIITNNDTKAKIIENLGIDYLFFIKFNEKLANMDEKKFVQLLKSNFKCDAIVCGYNFTYGKDGNGNVSTLLRHRKELNYKISIVDKISYDGQNISSSHIRHLIESGNIRESNKLLGYNYFIFGKVIKCKQLGRQLNFPTANIEILDNICLRNGVYISLTNINGKQYASISNIGKNPTVGDIKRMLETHIFDFNEDIYGKEICVELIEYVRDETKFKSIEELKNRVFMDIDIAKAHFSNNNIYNIINL